MTKTYIKREHGLFIAGRVLTIIEYVSALLALFIVGISLLSVAGVWQTIEMISEEVPAELTQYMSIIFYFVGGSCLVTLIPVAVVGGICLKRIGSAQTKEELLPWAIVTAVLISTIPGILLILASTLPTCRKEVVEVVE